MSIKQIRRFKKSSRVKSIIFWSKLFGLTSKTDPSMEYKHIEAVYSTFSCKLCKSLVVIDTNPLEFLEQKRNPISANKHATLTKRSDIQKVLDKSNIIKKSENNAKELDLESFLQGFI